MEPFFKTHAGVEEYVPPDVKAREAARISETVTSARQEARALSAQANSIIKPFGDAVVGGSSQAVGSPTNAARIAHFLAKGEVTGVKIELYPELFARRGINVPGILMAAVYGASTDNAQLYREIMDKVKTAGVTVEMLEVDEPQLQRITVHAKEQDSMVESFNRGGARLALRSATPSLEEALQVARKLNIDVVG
jgi:L-serine dehydratase